MAKITHADYNDYRIIGVSSRDSILPRGRAWAVFDTDRNHDQINYRSNRIIGRFVDRSLSLSLSLFSRVSMAKRCNADACTRSACAVSCVNALRRARHDLWDHGPRGPANRRPIFQESRDGRVVVPWETFSEGGRVGKTRLKCQPVESTCSNR